MNTTPRILVLSASYGGGHDRAAMALKGYWDTVLPGGTIHILDYVREFVHPIIGAAIRYFHPQSIRHAPLSAWRLIFDATNNLPPDSAFQETIDALGRRALLAHLQATAPDVVVSTYPLPARALAALKRAGRVRVPAATVITDHGVHAQWVHEGTDLYLVAGAHTRDDLRSRGVPEDRIVLSGIPIDLRFAQTFDRETLRRKHGVTDGLPTILVMAGAEGAGADCRDLVDVLGDFPRPLQAFIVCGRNRRLRARLETLAVGRRNPIHILGFVDTIPELMAIADILITKPGGLTTAEALARGLPMILYSPIPGQEEENALVLVAQGAAELAPSLEEVEHELDALLADPARLATMREAARRAAAPWAARTAGDAILLSLPWTPLEPEVIRCGTRVDR